MAADQHYKLINSRGSSLVHHAYHDWSTSVNAFVLTDRQTDRPKRLHNSASLDAVTSNRVKQETKMAIHTS